MPPNLPQAATNWKPGIQMSEITGDLSLQPPEICTSDSKKCNQLFAVLETRTVLRLNGKKDDGFFKPSV